MATAESIPQTTPREALIAFLATPRSPKAIRSWAASTPWGEAGIAEVLERFTEQNRTRVVQGDPTLVYYVAPEKGEQDDDEDDAPPSSRPQLTRPFKPRPAPVGPEGPQPWHAELRRKLEREQTAGELTKWAAQKLINYQHVRAFLAQLEASDELRSWGVVSNRHYQLRSASPAGLRSAPRIADAPVAPSAPPPAPPAPAGGTLAEAAKQIARVRSSGGTAGLRIAEILVPLLDSWETHKAEAGGIKGKAWAALVTGERTAASQARRRWEAMALLEQTLGGGPLDRDLVRYQLHEDVVVRLASDSVPADQRKAALLALAKETRKAGLLAPARAARVIAQVVERAPAAPRVSPLLGWVNGPLAAWVAAAIEVAGRAGQVLPALPDPPAGVRGVALGKSEGGSVTEIDGGNPTPAE